MNSFIKLIIALCLLSPAVAHTGLKAGSEFTNHRVQGPISVRCSDRGETRHANFTCRGSYLSPSIRSTFVYDSEIQADKVKISFTNSRGKNKSKSSKMKNFESKRSFNLWIRSLTQRPLLKSGENDLAYKLYRDGNVVETGEFSVTVESAPVRSCPYRSYYSNSLNDCTGSTTVCDRYFRDHNNCL